MKRAVQILLLSIMLVLLFATITIASFHDISRKTWMPALAMDPVTRESLKRTFVCAGIALPCLSMSIGMLIGSVIVTLLSLAKRAQLIGRNK